MTTCPVCQTSNRCPGCGTCSRCNEILDLYVGYPECIVCVAKSQTKKPKPVRLVISGLRPAPSIGALDELQLVH